MRRAYSGSESQRVAELAAVIGAPANALPTFGHTDDGARPHIEAHGPLMDYVVVERGKELLRETYVDLDGLLERVFRSVASEMASAFEARNRRPNEDFRRQMFAQKLEYLGTLSPRWAERERVRLNEILRRHPFIDDLKPADRI
jgi:hypothetical protein